MQTSVVAFICIYSGLASLGVESRRQGHDHVRERMIGSQMAHIENAPYQASIHSNGSYICSGALINDRYILTAAHCIREYEPHHLLVRLGSTSQGEGGEERKVDEVKIPEQYKNETYDFDIALIRMDHPVNETLFLRIIPLGTHEPHPGEAVLVTSWGSQMEKGKSHTDDLQFAFMPVVRKSECRKSYQSLYEPIEITENMFCAGYMSGGVGICNCDSGAPAVIDNVLVGIVLGGAKCAQPGYPGFYITVKNFIPWIKEQVENLPPVGHEYYYSDWRYSKTY